MIKRIYSSSQVIRNDSYLTAVVQPVIQPVQGQINERSENHGGERSSSDLPLPQTREEKTSSTIESEVKPNGASSEINNTVKLHQTITENVQSQADEKTLVCIPILNKQISVMRYGNFDPYSY